MEGLKLLVEVGPFNSFCLAYHENFKGIVASNWNKNVGKEVFYNICERLKVIKKDIKSLHISENKRVEDKIKF